MNALDLLTTRRSNKKLGLPTPNAQQLEQLFQAALHSPDHGRLQPYEFVVIEKQGLEKFEQLLIQACDEQQLDEKHYNKAKRLAQESPMVIAVIAKVQPNLEKIPEWEQIATASCATYAMQLTANAMGFDNFWVTAKWVNGIALRNALNCGEHDQIVALLRIGTAISAPEERKEGKKAKTFDTTKFVKYW